VIEHTRKSTYILWLLIPSLALVAARSFVHTNGQALDNHQVSKTQSAASRSEQITVRAAGRGNPYLNLRDGHDLLTTYVGKAAPVQMLQQDQAHPTSLASADFDEDGVPDLVTGYSSSGGGLLALYRGNVDSIFPNALEAKRHEAEGSFVDSPFFPSARVFEGPEAADFIEAGDFDGDGHWDVATAARGSALLQLFSGNGRGDLKLARSIQLPGTVTAVGAGEVNRRDGLTDIAVGIAGLQGPQVLVFESPLGALRGQPEVFSVPSEVVAMAMGQLDDEFTMDLAIAAGSELLTIHGRDRRLSLDEAERRKVPQAVLTKHSLDSIITSIAVGNFIGSEQAQIAVLLQDGRVQVVNESKGRNIRKRALVLPGEWRNASSLVRAKISSLPHDDLVLVDKTNHQLHVLGGEKELESSGRTSISLDLDNEPMVVLPMRLNGDALQDLVVLKDGPNGISISVTAPISTFVVNSTGDAIDCSGDDGVCSTGTINPQTGKCILTNECTLRAAINQANAQPGADAIAFSVLMARGDNITYGDRVVTDVLTIDGTSSPAGRVELRDFPLMIAAGNSLIRGTAINANSPAAFYDLISIHTKSGNIIEGNYIGTDVTGSIALGDSNSAITVDPSSPNNTIGGTAPPANNLISGNRLFGLVIFSTGNVVQGNFIGTDASGTGALGNVGAGVAIGGSNLAVGATANNLIGGTAPGARNIISGNKQFGASGSGIFIAGSATGTLVQGNYIGTDVTGKVDLGNGRYGVLINSVANNTIGGTSVGARNIISGNQSIGVWITGTLATGNSVQGNYIGTDLNGTADLGNTLVGVLLANGAANNMIGSGNVISGNNASGMEINSGATNNTIQGNYIGTDAMGTVPLGNGLNGILIIGASNNVVGGTTSGTGNVISGNAGGVGITSSTGNLVQGNFIGTDESGTVDIGNLGDGVTIAGPASNNLIGGTSSGARNIISGNDSDGVRINNAATGNMVQGNYIGTDVNGSADLGNSFQGVNITNASNNVIGGLSVEARNTISGNNSNGVQINGFTATGNQVRGNLIGTQSNGTSGLPNTGHGIFVTNSASDNTIGGTDSNAGNKIQNNGGDGVFVTSGTGNAIVGNSIFANVGMGIDLGANGVTSNDSGDVDLGANNLQNFPVLTSASGSGGKTTIRGTLDSKPGTAFTVASYSNSQCDPSAFGEGEAPLGSTTVTTDASGNANFIITSSSSLPVGYSVAATATDAAGNTSEFSRCLSVSVETFRLSVLITGNGSVVTTESGIACPTDCTEDYPSATKIGLIPIAGSGWKFDGWSGECQGSGPCVISMTTNRSVRANFSPIIKEPLLLNVTNGGAVISVPGSLNCSGPQTCTESYNEGEEFSLVPMAIADWEFRGWQGFCQGNVGPCHVTMNGPVATTAVFGRRVQRRITNPVGIPRLPIGRPVNIQFIFVPGSLMPLSSLSSRKDWELDLDQALTDADVNNVKVELSRDNGKTFETLFANIANVGSACWTVTGPATTEALIRVSSISDPSVFAISDQAFVIDHSGIRGMQLAAGLTGCEELSTSDQRSTIRGTSFYADRYYFFGSIGQQIAITSTSQALNSYLYLVGPDGSLIAEDNDGGGATDARIPAASGFLTLPATGTFVIEATSFDANALGGYQLRLDTGAVLLTAENTERALALDSVTMIRDPFPLLSTNFSPDQRTRVSLFSVNLELVPGETNSVVTAQAEDSEHRIYPLTVEFVGRVPNFPWLTQINVRLPDQLANAGDVWVRTSLRGVVGNRALINIR